jgi:hypothetical protein
MSRSAAHNLVRKCTTAYIVSAGLEGCYMYPGGISFLLAFAAPVKMNAMGIWTWRLNVFTESPHTARGLYCHSLRVTDHVNWF